MSHDVATETGFTGLALEYKCAYREATQTLNKINQISFDSIGRLYIHLSAGRHKVSIPGSCPVNQNI